MKQWFFGLGVTGLLAFLFFTSESPDNTLEKSEGADRTLFLTQSPAEDRGIASKQSRPTVVRSAKKKTSPRVSLEVAKGKLQARLQRDGEGSQGKKRAMSHHEQLRKKIEEESEIVDEIETEPDSEGKSTLTQVVTHNAWGHIRVQSQFVTDPKSGEKKKVSEVFMIAEEVMVQFDPGLNSLEIQEIVSPYGTIKKKLKDNLRIVQFQSLSAGALDSMIAAFQNQDGVQFAEPNFIVGY